MDADDQKIMAAGLAARGAKSVADMHRKYAEEDIRIQAMAKFSKRTGRSEDELSKCLITASSFAKRK